MNKVYDKIIELSKSVKAQNLFCAAKELSCVRLFKNTHDFSNLQEVYLSYLYNFDSLNRDIIVDKISPHVLDDKIYWDSYFLWKKKYSKQDNKKENKQRELSIVIRKDITFPNKEKQ
jgi:hypothetical protein